MVGRRWLGVLGTWCDENTPTRSSWMRPGTGNPPADARETLCLSEHLQRQDVLAIRRSSSCLGSFFGFLMVAACSASSAAGDAARDAASSHAGDGGCGCNHATEYAWYDGTNPGTCLPLPTACLGSSNYGYPYGDGGLASNLMCGCAYPPPDANIGFECTGPGACGLTLTAQPNGGSHSGSGSH